MTVRSIAALWILVLALVAWGVWGPAGADRAASSDTRGIAARLRTDRASARVGDPIGISIELDVPAAYEPAHPSPGTSDAFDFEAPRALAPQRRGASTLYVWQWTVRARQPGTHTLPELDIRLRIPDPVQQATSGTPPRAAAGGAPGDGAEPRAAPPPVVRVAGVPISVRSVRADMPGREELFDLRPAPGLPTAWADVLLLAWVCVFIGVTIAMVHSRRSFLDPVDPEQLARRTLAQLDALPDAGARSRAEGALRVLRSYVARRWWVNAQGRTSEEYPGRVDPRIRALMGDLERARFARELSEGQIEALVSALREYLGHAAAR